jgi:hypothetical protein
MVEQVVTRAPPVAAPLVNTFEPEIPDVPVDEAPSVDDAPPAGEMSPLDAALDEHFPDEPGHPDDSIYARTRRMFVAIVAEISGR